MLLLVFRLLLGRGTFILLILDNTDWLLTLANLLQVDQENRLLDTAPS